MNIAKDLVNFLFPAECHICEIKLAHHEKFICSHCLEKFSRTGYHRVRNNPMEERFAGQFPFEKATGLFFYSRGSDLSNLIQDMKYHGFPGIGFLLGEIAARELFPAGFFNCADYVTPVPMHWFKKILRGYNQAECIAKGISEALGIPIAKSLVMARHRKVQAKLSVEERFRNAERLFKPTSDIDLNGKTVILIDDICTTGTTLGAAAKTITDTWRSVNLRLLTIGVTF